MEETGQKNNTRGVRHDVDDLLKESDNKKAANEGGIKYKARDIKEITDETAEELLEWAEYGEFYDNTYLPMRKDTPLILINSTKNLDTGEISNHPMIISVKKARQALTPIGEY